jgi:xanthine dehydrogenase accessory factor
MAVAADGSWRGSISGGCVEGTLLDTARAVLGGAPPRVTVVSPGDQLMPWEPTPVCTSRLRVLVLPAPEGLVHEAITAALATDRILAVQVSLQPPYLWQTAASTVDLRDDAETFVEQLPRRRRLILVGATDLAATIARLAEPLRRRIIIIDPRPTHLQSGAFPPTAELIPAWPDQWITAHPLDETDAVVTLTHDPRIDDRGIHAALTGGAGHVAALGSHATHEQRLRRLHDTPRLQHLTGPAGLDLGGTSLAETALSILAGMVAVENDRTGGQLHDSNQPIRAQSPTRTAGVAMCPAGG